MTGDPGSGPTVEDVRGVLRAVLTPAAFPGRDELLAQAGTAEVVGGPLTMLDLRVGPGPAVSPCPDGPVPVSAIVVDADAAPVGELLVWVEAGYLSGLEYAWYSDEPPGRLPAPDRIRVD